MKLAALLEEKNVLIHLEVPNYAAALAALVDTLSDRLGRLSPEKVCERLMSVEEDLPLELGHGVRIPHARMAGVNSLLLAIGTSENGIPVREGSAELAHLIFVILTPKTQSTLMLQTMSSIARLVTTDANRSALISTTMPARLLRILEESGIQVKKAIVAADLMNVIKHSAKPDSTMRQVVEILSNSNEEGIPVVNENDELLGDISTRMVVEVGLPRYMKLISDSQVLSEFEPFEAFYKKEDTLTADEVMNREPLALSPETPAEILAHEMLTKLCERVYVVEEKKLLGVVYRKDIVRKILNL